MGAPFLLPVVLCGSDSARKIRQDVQYNPSKIRRTLRVSLHAFAEMMSTKCEKRRFPYRNRRSLKRIVEEAVKHF